MKSDSVASPDALSAPIHQARQADVRPIDPSTTRPRPPLNWFSPIWRAICGVFLRLTGWRLEGDWPAEGKIVVIAAPHTSNVDAIYMLAAAGFYNVKLRWMGKKELTTGPFGWFVSWLGCVPIDRSAKNDVVRQMVEAFEAADLLALAVPPEGTRAKTREWKSGFYHIAHQAGVPLLMSVLDFGSRRIRLKAVVTPGGDYERDLVVIQSFYRDARGLREGDFSVDRDD
ncbi:MAG: acyltransferase [Alphaproteobacteria bacterium]|nr:acyltransferase [Alphaproteobacteria bacterium]